MNALVQHDATKTAIAKAESVAEAKDWRAKATAMQTWAKQAQDYTRLDQATDIRLRAEIRAGELLAEMKVRGERRKPSDERSPRAKAKATNTQIVASAPTLSDLGITYIQSSRWQKLAALPRAEQDAVIRHAQERARAAIAGAQSRKKKPDDDAETGPEFEMTERAVVIALRVRELVMKEARAMRPEDRKSLLLALRYEARDMPSLFVREFGKAGK